jgi:hypothetical protein
MDDKPQFPRLARDPIDQPAGPSRGADIGLECESCRASSAQRGDGGLRRPVVAQIV